jgi:hypothetical protein
MQTDHCCFMIIVRKCFAVLAPLESPFFPPTSPLPPYPPLTQSSFDSVRPLIYCGAAQQSTLGLPSDLLAMPSQVRESQIVNVYGGCAIGWAVNIFDSSCLGGVGGNGGVGGIQGQGGGGGAGEGPRMNYDVRAEHFTVQLVLPNHKPDDPSIGPPTLSSWSERSSRDLTGATRKPRHGQGARQAPYGTFHINYQSLLIIVPLRSLFSPASCTGFWGRNFNIKPPDPRLRGNIYFHDSPFTRPH